MITIPNEFKRNENESEESYIVRVGSLKDKYKYTWADIANISNAELNYNYTESYYRKHYKFYLEDAYLSLTNNSDENISSNDGALNSSDVTLKALQDTLKELRTERIRLQDEKNQNAQYIRRLSREDTCKDMALEVAREISSKKFLNIPSVQKIQGTNKGILCIGDWHYGCEFNNFYNSYNPEVAERRVAQLCAEVKRLCEEEKVSDLYVVNLSDLIAGRIHAQIRIQSRYDVITQTIKIAEILAEFLTELSCTVNSLNYYDCLDNHSRIEPNKKESLNLESLARFIPWYLKERLRDNTKIFINDNSFGQDIISFRCGNYTIGGVHGDRDKPSQVVNNITLYTREDYDLILTAHLHHFSCDEKNGTLVISNGSLMGTDDYAESLRLNSKPSQNFIVVSENNVAEEIHRIILD